MCVILGMDTVQYLKRNFDTITQPGLRGPIGNPIQNWEWRQSCPELEPVKFALSLNELKQRGANLQNGHIPSPFTGGYGPLAIEENDYQYEFHPYVVGEKTLGRVDNVNLDGFNLPNPGDEWRARMLYENKGSKSDHALYPLPGGVGRRSNTLINGRTRTIFTEESDGPVPTTNFNVVGGINGGGGSGGIWNQPCRQNNPEGTAKPVKTDQAPPPPA